MLDIYIDYARYLHFRTFNKVILYVRRHVLLNQERFTTLYLTFSLYCIFSSIGKLTHRQVTL